MKNLFRQVPIKQRIGHFLYKKSLFMPITIKLVGVVVIITIVESDINSDIRVIKSVVKGVIKSVVKGVIKYVVKGVIKSVVKGVNNFTIIILITVIGIE